jgi:hypothetical protein
MKIRNGLTPFNKNDVNKKLYRVVKNYTLSIVQYIKAVDRDIALNILASKGGINYEEITPALGLDNGDTVQTESANITYIQNANLDYIGTIVPDEESSVPDDYICDQYIDEVPLCSAEVISINKKGK